MTSAATEAAREQMIQQQLRAWEVLDPSILEVFARVPREKFVPPAYVELAFADIEIPLNADDRMLAPKVAGRIMQAVTPLPTDRVLLVGVGTGFLAACLAARACSVRGLELREDLAVIAIQNLRNAGVRNVTVECRNAFEPEALLNGAYDVIVLSGSLPVPDERFAGQLAIGGRLFAVIGLGPVMEAYLIERVAAEAFRSTGLFETALKPLVGARQPERFNF
ncbi:MAG: protein-L-isoaspartate O-methyltransferase [Gammaproteobacteria bacterium]|nr:protein-L-isoaspartate O-methyltransferase [Gammaproteobacteria bacterium]